MGDNYEVQPLESLEKHIVPVINVVRDAVEEATTICDATYDIAPTVSYVVEAEDMFLKEFGTKAYPSITDPTRTTKGIHETSSATFVRAWVHYTLIELLKNAMCITIERNPKLVNSIIYDSD